MTTKNRLILLLKSSDDEIIQDPYIEELKKKDYVAFSISTLSFEFQELEKLAHKLNNAESYRGLILTSKRAVEAVASAAEYKNDNLNTKQDVLDKWRKKQVFVVGPATFSATKQKLSIDGVGRECGSAEILANLIGQEVPDIDESRPLIFPCSSIKRDVLPKTLNEMGIAVECFTCYQTIPSPTLEEDITNFVRLNGFPGIVVFFSPSGVKMALPILRKVYDSINPNRGSTNKNTQEILRRYGYLRCGGNLPPLHLFGYGKKKNKHHNNNNNADGTANQWKRSPNQGCSEEAFRQALKQYQQTYNMIGTGALDTPTLKMMSESRCGNPDAEENIPPRPMFRTKRGKKLRRKINAHNKGHKGHGRSRNKRDDPVTSTDIPDPIAIQESLIRRRKWMEDRVQDLSTGVQDERLEAIHNKYMTTKKRRRDFIRTKRSVNDNSVYFPSEVVTWRLVGSATSEQLDINLQRSSLGQAFRMWGEVIPLVFYEDNKSPVEEVDVLIAFGKGEHLNCPNNFDGYGGQLSHAVRAKSSAEIHVDDDEHLTVRSEQGTNLVKVAVHEVGHALGLHHTSLNNSIMYAIYNKVYPHDNFELSTHDRRMIQAIYGICRGKFDTVFDWVRPRYEGGDSIYNTYFFRENRIWMYENKYGRPRYGDPISLTNTDFQGLPDRIDAYLHVWDPDFNSRYFFKGKQYWKYDVSEKNVSPGYPRNISDDFGSIPGTNFPSIPNHLDSAFFDQRDGNIYFFKGSLVYAYDPSRGHHGCCLPGYPKEISQEFPISLSKGDGGEEVIAPNKSRALSNLDAVYYSYTDKGMYFFKGNTYYENVAFNPGDRRRVNKLKGPKDVANKWRDICNVEL